MKKLGLNQMEQVIGGTNWADATCGASLAGAIFGGPLAAMVLAPIAGGFCLGAALSHM